MLVQSCFTTAGKETKWVHSCYLHLRLGSVVIFQKQDGLTTNDNLVIEPFQIKHPVLVTKL